MRTPRRVGSLRREADDFREQLHELNRIAPTKQPQKVDGVFLTHAHVGHYVGLMHFGREVLGADQVPVHAMPRMREFLKSNGPWSQLVADRNIEILELADGCAKQLNERISVTPFLVPHRDEHSETVGFRVNGPSRSVVFIPDIDKWEHWTTRIEDVLGEVDVA